MDGARFEFDSRGGLLSVVDRDQINTWLKETGLHRPDIFRVTFGVAEDGRRCVVIQAYRRNKDGRKYLDPITRDVAVDVPEVHFIDDFPPFVYGTMEVSSGASAE